MFCGKVLKEAGQWQVGFKEGGGLVGDAHIVVGHALAEIGDRDCLSNYGYVWCLVSLDPVQGELEVGSDVGDRVDVSRGHDDDHAMCLVLVKAVLAVVLGDVSHLLGGEGGVDGSCSRSVIICVPAQRWRSGVGY